MRLSIGPMELFVRKISIFKMMKQKRLVVIQAFELVVLAMSWVLGVSGTNPYKCEYLLLYTVAVYVTGSSTC